MKKLYEKSKLNFTLIWIGIYIVTSILADQISAAIGIKKIITAPVGIALVLIMSTFLVKNHLTEKYGFCKFKGKARDFLYFIPLIPLFGVTLWNGVTLNGTYLEIILHIIAMCCVGFMEELLFRGFLFKTMAEDNVKSAVIVSSITFGFGHTIREDVLDQVVFETVKQHVSLLLDVDKALKKYDSMSWEKNKIKKLEDNIAVQGELVQKNNLLRMGIYEDFKAGLLDRTEYDTLRSEITERIEDAEIAIEHLKQELRELTEGVTSQQEWIAQFRQYENISNLSRKTIMHLVERINVFEDATIEIVFRHQDQINEIMEFIAEQERKCKIITMPRLEVV